MTILTNVECKAIYELISEMTGGNPENVFAWDGTDDLSDPRTSGMRKIFDEAGARLPDNIAMPMIPDESEGQ